MLSVAVCVSLRCMPQKAASKFRRQRLARGMTLRELAEKCATEGAPVGDSQLSKIERGLYTPRPKLRVVLARVLEMDISELGAK